MVVLVLLASLATVTVGAEALVRGASALALRAGVSALFVGLTVVGFGTSSPELAASLTATLRGANDVSVGNVVGSNIFNVGIILGLTALIQPVRVRLRAVRRDLLVAIGVCVVPWISLLAGGEIPRLVGALLILALAFYVWMSWRATRRVPEEDEALARDEVETTLSVHPARARIWANVGLIVLGLAMLIAGSRWFVDAALVIARAVGLSDLVIGLTVVSAGTSAPELVTSLVAARRRNPDIAIGNVIGSIIFNLLGILGAGALVAPQVVNRQVIVLDTVVMLGFTLALLPIMKTGGLISRREGIALILVWAAYTALLLVRS